MSEYVTYDLPQNALQYATDSTINFRNWRSLSVEKIINDINTDTVHHQYLFDSPDYLPIGTVSTAKEDTLLGQTEMPEVSANRSVKLTMVTRRAK